jgi:hypothetical protein
MPTAESTTARLDARYGRSPDRRRRRRVLGVVAAFDGDGSELEARDTGYQITDDRSVEVQYTVSTDPGTPVRCAVQALNNVQAIVGWKVVDLPATGSRSTTYTTSLATTERAVTGLIYRCWLP